MGSLNEAQVDLEAARAGEGLARPQHRRKPEETKREVFGEKPVV